MGLKRIDERLSRVTTIIKGWKSNKNVPRIERDLALEELRQVYDEILDYTPEESEEESAESTESVVREVVTPIVVAESISDIVDDFDDALDIDALLGIGVEETEEAAEENVAETHIEPEVHDVEMPVTPEVVEPETPEPLAEVEDTVAETPQQTPDTEVAAEEPNIADIVAEVPQTPQATEESESGTSGALFNLEDIPVRAKRGRKMVHLYNDDYTPRVVAPRVEETPIVETPVAPQEVVSPQPIVPQPTPVADGEVPVRLGDVLRGDVTTLADAMAASENQEPTTPFNRIDELRKAIGLNDKFLMIRDLFGGDAERYEATIDTLDEFDDLDECMIYIVENFHWNPDSEAAKLIVSLLERKLA